MQLELGGGNAAPATGRYRLASAHRRTDRYRVINVNQRMPPPTNLMIASLVGWCHHRRRSF